MIIVKEVLRRRPKSQIQEMVYNYLSKYRSDIADAIEEYVEAALVIFMDIKNEKLKANVSRGSVSSKMKLNILRNSLKEKKALVPVLYQLSNLMKSTKNQ